MRRWGISLAAFAVALLATISAEAGLFCPPRLPCFRLRLPAIRLGCPPRHCAPACRDRPAPAPKANGYYDQGHDEPEPPPAPDEPAPDEPAPDEPAPDIDAAPPPDLPPGEPLDDEASPSDAPVNPVAPPPEAPTP